MAGNYDVEHLIALVHQRPVLWNKTLDTYKDKLLTKQAWQDICCELDPEFGSKTEGEKHDYARDVMKKWWNVRDNYVKICKKMAISPIPVKKYLYHNLLQFLPINGKKFKKEFNAASVEANVLPVIKSQPTEFMESFSDHSCDEALRKPIPSATKKRKVVPQMTPKKYELVVQPEDRHISFFRGIMPSLESFDDDDVIQFQMGVLQLIADIKSHRRMHQTEPNHQASSSTFNNDDDSPPVKMEYLG